ncbi:MAG: uroporphyrinogen decarboxylase [Lentisphaerae bacterium]|nr:MAG: uroporphyrinogen decarboxylase [Lentisphaerota bacterium]
MSDNCFLRACRHQTVEKIPVWYLNQHGRHLTQYRQLREQYSLEQLLRTPEHIATLTVGPIDEYHVDAAVLFTDLMPVLEGMGLRVNFGDGLPHIENPIRSHADIDSLILPDIRSDLAFIMEGIREARERLAVEYPLIGFAGAPFSLACYAVEGGVSASFTRTKQLMYSEPKWWHRLMEKITGNVTEFMTAQVENGCNAIELVDSFVGILSPFDFREYVSVHLQRLASSFHRRYPETPILYYSQQSSSLLPMIAELDLDVLHVDWRVELMRARRLRDQTLCLQGNLDPVLLLGDEKTLLRQAGRLLDVMGSTRGFIFNVGHFLAGETPGERIRMLTDFVHQYQPG